MMDWYLSGLVLVGAILLFMGIRVPVAFAFLAANLDQGRPVFCEPWETSTGVYTRHLDPELEFLIVLIPGGAFSTALTGIEPGQPIELASAVFGFFLEPQLSPGDTLWMLATGTGLGPYVSLLRTPGALDRYQRLILVHSTRIATELAYRDELESLTAASGGRLSYLPIVTREEGPSPLRGRIPQLIADGSLQQHARALFDPASGRVMVCGNPDFTSDMRALLNERGFLPCRRGNAGSMLFEKYW